jgi:phage terminase large subunit GpA-like protein
MMSGGRWIPQNKGHHYKGYKLPSFYSPVGWLSWNQIAREFIKAYALMKKGAARLMQVWVNTRKAETFEKQLDGVNISNANDRVEQYPAEVPNDVLILTCGVDTQDDRFELEVLGHARNGETFSIDYKVIAGDPQFDETKELLDLYLFTKTFKRADGGIMKIYGTGVDTGGHRTKTMYEYCKARANQNVFAFKGANTITAPITNKVKSQMPYGELTLFSIGVTALKDNFFANLAITEIGANFQHFPNKPVYNKKYFDMLTAEKRNDKGGYEKIRLRNEALDCRIYALGVLAVLEVMPNSLPHPILYIGDNEAYNTNKKKVTTRNISNDINNYLDEF